MIYVSLHSADIANARSQIVLDITFGKGKQNKKLDITQGISNRVQNKSKHQKY